MSTFGGKLALTINIPYILVENNQGHNYFTAKYDPIFY